MKIHEKYMQRCLDLAENGLGTTYPNPLVGCVIVYEGSIVSEGWHQVGGQAHAEVNAINALDDHSILPECTLYVNLEPCSHHGRTPPCANLIISKGIKKIVVGSVDPNPNVAGKGIERLRNAGCDVTVGILEEACEQVNRRFFTSIRKKRPYVIIKWAQTENGFFAPNSNGLDVNFQNREPVWITGKAARQSAHKLRASEHAILVGANTVQHDNPSLTTRLWDGPSPIRIVLDKNLSLPANAKVFDTHARTIVLTEVVPEPTSQIESMAIDFDDALPEHVLNALNQYEIRSVIIEGGAKTLQRFITANLWDEAYLYIGKKEFEDGIIAPRISGTLMKEVTLGKDTLSIYKNTAS